MFSSCTKKTKPLTGAQKKKHKRDLKEKEEQKEQELVADIERLKLGPTDLWKLITDYPDIFETHVLKSGYLNESDIKMFYGSCRASRRAVKRAKIKLQQRFYVQELSSISTLELAWEGYSWGERVRSPSGREVPMNQEWFCSQVALTNDLKLLRWVREEKECAWNYLTICAAAVQGNLDMLKYCCENGCEVDEDTCAFAAGNGQLACLKYLRSKNIYWNIQICELAHKNNHMDILTYAVRNKCPGYEEYEQYIPK
jgi:hypothetical protein